MKKISIFVLMFSIFSTLLNADFIRAEIGAGLYDAEVSGELTDKDGTFTQDLGDGFDIDQESSLYLWAYFKHPIPLIPNVRVEYLSLQHDTPTQDKFKINELDAILYYNILDDTLFMTLDLGLDFKNISSNYADLKDITIILAYARARVDPTDAFGAEVLIKYVSYLENIGYDARVKLDYTLTFIPVVQPALELGYRVHKIEYEAGRIVNKVGYSGVYGGVMIRF